MWKLRPVMRFPFPWDIKLEDRRGEMSEQRAEGFWWVRFTSYGLRSKALGDAPPGPWRPLWLTGYGNDAAMLTAPPENNGRFEVAAKDVREWGPFLGKEPGACHWCARPLADHPPPLMVVTVDGARPATPEEEAEHERERAASDVSKMQAWVDGLMTPELRSKIEQRAIDSVIYGADFNPSTDYEGEDTRALDGAGVTITMPSEDGGPAWTVTIVASPDLESAAAEHEMIPLDGIDEGPFGYTTSLLAVREEPKP